MTFEVGFFFFIATLAVASGILMVTRRNPVQCVLFLIVNFFCLAILYLTLQAEFIAIIQILVYAGAIMVLFLFVIMLLNLGDETKMAEKKSLTRYLAFLLSGVMAVLIITGLGVHHQTASSVPSEGDGGLGSVESIGKVLFSTYLFPFEVTSLLLLAAMVGVIVLAKKNFRQP